MKSKAKKFPKAKNPKAGKSEAQLESRLPPRNTPGLPPPLNVRPAKPAPVKESYPDWILDLPDHLDGFGTAIQQERKNCVKLLTDAMEEYDDAIYDVVIDCDGEPKDVLTAMKKGRDAILALSDEILGIACTCAEDRIEAPPSVQDMIMGHDAREVGDDINAALCESDSMWQYEFCQTLVRNLTHDAREALLNALLP